jgi:hypothetical protein
MDEVVSGDRELLEGRPEAKCGFARADRVDGDTPSPHLRRHARHGRARRPDLLCYDKNGRTDS